jgi:hypothetical protein
MKSGSRMLAQVAVFARNHGTHLDSAARVSSRNPEELVTFRSVKPWITAAKAVTAGFQPTVYYAVVGGGAFVQYQAQIAEIILRPDPTDPDVQRLLDHEAETTRGEGLWSNQVKTLYAVVGCHKLASPLPQSGFTKYHDGSPLSDAYIRNYALVRALAPVAA